MTRYKQMWIFRIIFWILAFINFLGSTQLFKMRFDMNYLYYYTELSNFLVFVWITYMFVKKIFKLKSMRRETSVKFIVTVGIMLTFLVYNTLLGHIFSVSYWQISNVLKHFLLPLIMLMDYLFYTPRKTVGIRDTFKALVFPLIYFVYAMIRGLITHKYPYFFINPTEIGYLNMLYFFIGILFCIYIFSYSLYLLNKKRRL